MQEVSGAGAMNVARLVTRRVTVAIDNNNNKEKVTIATINATRTNPKITATMARSKKKGHMEKDCYKKKNLRTQA
jgi:hypothetical protein